MSNFVRHPYHLVDESPWPLLSALAAFFMTTGMVKWFHTSDCLQMLLATFAIVLIAFQWWWDISAEGVFQGNHTGLVELGLRWGMMLFILSEVFIFVSFFWAYFHMSLAPSPELGASWPPTGVQALDPLHMPLLNTVVLIVSGLSITWSHHALLEGKTDQSYVSLSLTNALGSFFIYLQKQEYAETTFTIADSVYGSVFYLATGFHGFHVYVGATFLTITGFRMSEDHFSTTHHFGFEACAWYWHFVDVVWLFLYISIYWWGSL